MKLHYSPKSPYVRTVLVCAHELGCAEHISLVRSTADMLSPNASIMMDNPLNKIPTLVLGDGRTLFDSRVICEYLNDTYQGSLFPNSGHQKWQNLRWQAFANGLMDVLVLWRNERERPVPVAPLIKAFNTKLLASLALLEQESTELAQTSLQKNVFHIGHIGIACCLGYLDFRFESINWRSLAPKLAAWFEVMNVRASMQATGPVFD